MHVVGHLFEGVFLIKYNSKIKAFVILKHYKNIKNASGGKVKILSSGAINRCVGVKASIETQAHRFCTHQTKITIMKTISWIMCVLSMLLFVCCIYTDYTNGIIAFGILTLLFKGFVNDYK